jgi:AcrR family transcriptional regulator
MRPQASTAAITQAARRVLAEQGATRLSLRAVARDLGISAPALYRYFPSREHLLGQLVADLYDEVSGELERSRDAVPADDTAGRLLAVSRSFRAWALAHSQEFALLFGTPIEGLRRRPGSGEGPARRAGHRFGAIFAALFAGVYLARRFPAPADAEIEPALRAQLQAWLDTFPLPLPLGVLQVFLSCWIRLYSAVCLEVFGHLSFAVTDAGAIFEAELRSLAHLLASPASYRPPTTPG